MSHANHQSRCYHQDVKTGAREGSRLQIMTSNESLKCANIDSYWPRQKTELSQSNMIHLLGVNSIKHLWIYTQNNNLNIGNAGYNDLGLIDCGVSFCVYRRLYSTTWNKLAGITSA